MSQKTPKPAGVKYFWKKYRLCIAAFLVVFSLLLFVRLHVSHITTGDEPHYLIMDYSLQKDGDFNLKNNYINGDFLRYYFKNEPPHVSQLNIQSNSGGWYSFHGVGLPLLIFPAFVVAEKLGPILLMTLIAAAVVILLFFWARLVTRDKKAAIFTGLSLSCIYFFNGLSGYLYPDIPISALMIVCFAIMTTKLYKQRVWQVMLALSLAAMVFLHFRTLAFAVPFAFVFLYLNWRDEGKQVPWAFIIPGSLFAGIFFITLYMWFGVLMPNDIYSSHVGVSVASLVHNTPAILFDSLRGVIVYSPILLIIPIGLPLWYKYHKRSFLLLLTLLPLLYVTFGFNEWHGGYAPNGRYVMGLLPILLPAIGFFYVYAKGFLNRLLLYSLLAATTTISLVATVVKQPYTGYSTRSDIFITIEKYIHIPLDKPFPTYYFVNNTITDSNGVAQAIFWMLVLVTLVFYGVYLSRKTAKA